MKRKNVWILAGAGALAIAVAGAVAWGRRKSQPFGPVFDPSKLGMAPDGGAGPVYDPSGAGMVD